MARSREVAGRLAGAALCVALLAGPIACTLDRSPAAGDGARAPDDDAQQSGGTGGTGGMARDGAVAGAGGTAGPSTGGASGAAGAGGVSGSGGASGASGASGSGGMPALDAGTATDAAVGGPPGCVARPNMVCDCPGGVCPSCPGGGCTYYCFTGICSASCPSGDCQFLCSPSANCTLDCGGGELLQCPLCTSPAPCPLSCGQQTPPALIGCFG